MNNVNGINHVISNSDFNERATITLEDTAVEQKERNNVAPLSA